MNDVLAILGRQPALGMAELESLYGAASVTPAGPHAALITTPSCPVDAARLGGTVKTCAVLTRLPATRWKDVERALPDIAITQAANLAAGKLHVGISAYGFDVTPPQLLAAGLTIKKAIQKAHGRSVRLAPNNTPALSTAQVLHNRLAGDTGCELICVQVSGMAIIARTTYVQDIASYTLRDRGRPKRDARVGMLPPKLAQIILNLALGPQACADGQQRPIVLDPFCGTGVILQEALLAGYSAYGTDKEPRMIAYSRANLDWLAGQYHLSSPPPRLDVGDATSYQWQTPIGAVACETYLGRPFTALPAPELLTQTASDCGLIIKKFLRTIHGQLQPGTRLCLAVPAWQTRPGSFRHLPLIDQLSAMGYNRVSFEHLRDEDLLYYRDDQIVARQLLVITRK